MNCCQKKFFSNHLSLHDKGHYMKHVMLIKLLEMTSTLCKVIDIKCHFILMRVYSTYNWTIAVILVSNSSEGFGLLEFEKKSFCHEGPFSLDGTPISQAITNSPLNSLVWEIIKYFQKSVKKCQELMFSPQNEGLIINNLPNYSFCGCIS